MLCGKWRKTDYDSQSDGDMVYQQLLMEIKFNLRCVLYSLFAIRVAFFCKPQTSNPHNCSKLIANKSGECPLMTGNVQWDSARQLQLLSSPAEVWGGL